MINRTPARDRPGVVALVGYLRDLERSLPRNDDLYGAMPDGFGKLAISWVRSKPSKTGPPLSHPDGRARARIEP
jgi:hypothetical protein